MPSPLLPDNITAYVGAKIRERRKYKAISTKAMSWLLGVDEERLDLMENGRSTITVIHVAKAAAALDMPVSYFFGEDNDRETE